ncbi:unnamed protein product [Dovyalis caffra]|uniref:Uncharacterized protein n=1 Tax=Dovyalis caffra TaxID=77055 RepID=A0AAV1SMQ4_9ROSI|nr:unnamed protein product [Dovyalis caffra]
MTTTSTLPEIIELFSKLALDLQTQTHNSPFNQSQEQEVNDSSTDPSISKLTLSLTHNSRVRVLDTALSLMCFKAPQVLDSVIEYSVKTIVSVLSSSISCEVFRFHNEEVLQIGSFISRSHCVELIVFVFDVILKLRSMDALFDNLTKLSERWILKESCSDNSQNGMIGYKKKVKKPKFCDSKENSTLGNKYDSQVIILWLNQFQNIMKHNESIDKSACCEAKSYAVHQQHDRLFRRIPLGILIGSSGYMNEDGYELLLHYAATSRILSSHGTENTSLNHVNQNSSRPEQLIGGINKKEAVSGACLVFSLIDVVEKMSVSLFETEESRVGFICMVKLRAGRYLIKCIKSLIQFNVDEDGVPMLLDLQGRLERWRHQGKEVSELQKDLDEALKGLSHELSL